MKDLCGNISCSNCVNDECTSLRLDGLVPYVFVGDKQKSIDNCKGYWEVKGGLYEVR